MVGAQEGPAGAAAPKAWAARSWGTGSPAEAVVGAQGGPTGDSGSPGPGTPTYGNGESGPRGGHCLGRARWVEAPNGPGAPALGGQRALLWRRPVPGGREGAVVCSAGCPPAGGSCGPAWLAAVAATRPDGSTPPASVLGFPISRAPGWVLRSEDRTNSPPLRAL